MARWIQFWNILTCNWVNFILLQSTVPFIMYSRWKCTFQIAPCLLLIHVITQFCYSQVGIFYQFWTICQPQGLRVWPKNKNNSNATPIPVSLHLLPNIDTCITRTGFFQKWLQGEFPLHIFDQIYGTYLCVSRLISLVKELEL